MPEHGKSTFRTQTFNKFQRVQPVSCYQRIQQLKVPNWAGLCKK
ncbi:MAG: Unknown protein [uncultured Thiotrichaceae bacterium]|uniref:Uncharacterized protein n=1 Tax=uncultured Thiotrichaceae bacterium TaxID=298394 RepID=A0A6S6THK4_9GAMM|nr:MAG: Unknown protein [uncultured Thiotrichaceae bacterium]